VIKAEQDLPGTEGRRGERVGEGCRGGEMAQTIYAHVNKCIVKSVIELKFQDLTANDLQKILSVNCSIVQYHTHSGAACPQWSPGLSYYMTDL
jgi:hypothetical protein